MARGHPALGCVSFVSPCVSSDSGTAWAQWRWEDHHAERHHWAVQGLRRHGGGVWCGCEQGRAGSPTRDGSVPTGMLWCMLSLSGKRAPPRAWCQRSTTSCSVPCPRCNTCACMPASRSVPHTPSGMPTQLIVVLLLAIAGSGLGAGGRS